MPTESDLRDYLSDVREIVPLIGGEVVETIDEEIEDGNVLGIRAKHGQSVYIVIGQVDKFLPYIEVIFPYNFINDFAKRQAVENADISPEKLEDEGELDIELNLQESVKKLDDFAQENPEAIKNIRHNLFDKISTTDTSYSSETSDNGVVLNFQIRRKIFPEENELTPSKFNEIVQSVVSVGVKGRRSLANTFNLDMPIEIETEAESEEELRYFG